MRVVYAAGRWVFVVCLPLLLVTSSIWWAANSHWLYTSGFEKYDVGRSTGLSGAELEKVAAGLIAYFNSPKELLDLTVVREGQPVDVFTAEETLHFRDVKHLFRLDLYILIGTAAYVGGYTVAGIMLGERRRLARAALCGSGLALALMLLLGIGTLLDFDGLFLGFHRLAFTNELWSAEGRMLLLFPRDFWYDAAVYCAAATGGAALGLALVTGTYLTATRVRPGAPPGEDG